MLLRNLFIFIYLIIVAILLGTFRAPIELWLGFSINILIITFITYYHIFIEKTYSPFLSTYIVFNFLFFIVAPIVQIGVFSDLESPKFEHNLPYKENLFIKANYLISTFHIVFFLFYIGIKGLIKNKAKQIAVKSIPSAGLLIRDISFITLLSIVFIIIGLPFLIDEYVRHNWLPSVYSPGYQLIFKKALFSIPIAAIVICKYIFDKKNLSTQTWLINLAIASFLLVLILLLKNPLIEKRNALGPAYLLLIFLFLPKLLNSNVKTSLFLFLTMIVGFPVVQLLTHLEFGIIDIVNDPSLLTTVLDRGDLSKGFMSLNYDAFGNIGLAIEVVEKQGLSYGFQLLSALLFFVPRTLWIDKPDASGLVLGNHVIEEYGFNFANLSNPLVSEGYMNFGIFGIFVMAFALAVTCVFFLTWLNSSDYLKRATAFYFAIHLLFLLRGDFTNGYSYFVGVFFGIYVIPKMTIRLSRFVLDKNIWIVKK